MKYIKYIILILLLFASPVWATNYYVTPTGNASDPDCSEDTENIPTCAGAYDQSDFEGLSGTAYAGDTFYFTGTFTSKLDIGVSGAGGNYVTIDGYYADDCDPINSTCSSSALIDTNGADGIGMDGKDYIVVQDFRITDFNEGITIGGGSDYIYIKRNQIYESWGSGNALGILGENGVKLYTSSNVVIGGTLGDGNNIYDISYEDGNSAVAVSTYAAGPTTISYNHLWADSEVDGGDGIVAVSTENVTVEYNRIHGHYREDGIDFKRVVGGTIRFNIIYDNGHVGKEGQGITVQRSSQNVQVYGNNVYQNTGTGILLQDNDDCCGAVDNIDIWGNLVWENAQSGITLSSGEDGVTNVNIYNNVIAENNTLGNGTSHGLNLRTGGSTTSVKNNIFYKNNPTLSDYRQAYLSSTPNELDYNYYFWPGQTSVVYYSGGNRTVSTLQGTYSVEAAGADDDQEMTDPDNNDYTLQSTSPCIGAGDSSIGASYDDILDPVNTDWTTTPPQPNLIDQDDHDSWEIGAYVYTASTSDPVITVSTPDPLAKEETTSDGDWTLYCSPNCSSTVVTFALTGTATGGTTAGGCIAGVDYTTASLTTVTLNGASGGVNIVACDDALVEELFETAIITIQADPSGTDYTVGTPATGTINIEDDEFTLYDYGENKIRGGILR